MKAITIKGTIRKEISKQEIKELRNNKQVICVLYGGEKNVHFSADSLQFRQLVYTPDVHIVNLEIDGNTYQTIMKDIQFHPIHDTILHVDFLEISPDKEVEIHVPVKLSGASEGVKEGGKLLQKMRKIRISALPAVLPDNIEIDITPLKIGDSVRIGNLKKEGVTFLDSTNNIVVGVRVTRAVVEETPTVAPVTGAAPAAAVAAPAEAEKKAPEKK
ncbi:MAG: 50S ribosomal protein L25/general stress protein Ctc [Bacteroidia bacterium]|nr:50S ribosomal protein L25/general stress protein Ctc [Bacteroidia bacterium]MCZ2276464.1 50S ribosomal protein L25/general stress protein Ctc [Bacteroidia bacterium]